MAADPDYDGEQPDFEVPPFVSGLIFGRPFGEGEVPEDTGDPALDGHRPDCWIWWRSPRRVRRR
jgi:hypothetical protein